MPFTFAVDDVRAADEPLPTRRFRDVLAAGAICVGAPDDARVVEMPSVHPLLGAVHLAFAEHRPLVLSPDAVWLTIAEGVAHHVRRNAEALRSRLVRHAGREAIEVTWSGELPTEPEAWQAIIGAFRAEIAKRTGPGLARLFVCDFSTSTEVDRVASEIVLMDAVSPYFDFFVACVCGIPEVTLTGTPEDWRTIRARIDVIEELDLREWARSLKPIADALVRASEGQPDIAMWQRIYKPRNAYGWDRVTGWIARLFPYVKSGGSASLPNPLLALDFSEPSDAPSPNEWYDGPGIGLEDVPAAPSSVIVRVHDATNARTHELDVSGGLMGVEHDARGALCPISAYVIRPRTPGILDAIERIVRDHRYSPPEALEPHRMPETGTAEQLAIAARLGTATLLFSGERVWQLRAWRDRQSITVKPSDGMTTWVQRWLDLPDGRFIGHALTAKGHVYVLGDARFLVPRSPLEPIDEVTGLPLPFPRIEIVPEQVDTTQRAQDFPVLGSSLAAILDHALEHDGALLAGEPSTLDEYAVRPIVPRPALRPRS